MKPGYYSNVMFYSYWLQCKNYFRWGFDPCRKMKKDCVRNCVSMCERSHEFKKPSFVLHVWGCNLRCKFCWSECIYSSTKIEKAPEKVVEDLLCKLRVLNSDKWISGSPINPNNIECIRITGHEPTLQWDHMVELLKVLDKRKEFSNFWINVQTNGIETGKPESRINVGDLEGLENLKIRIEISFKGVNPKQFEWLTTMPSKFFYYQCDAFDKFWNIRSDKINIVPELGIGHCNRLKGKKFYDFGVYIIDENGNKLDFEDFDPHFEEKVLSKTSLEVSEENEFQEFKGIDKDRAREVIATYSKTSGEVKKRCLPSELSLETESKRTHDTNELLQKLNLG